MQISKRVQNNLWCHELECVSLSSVYFFRGVGNNRKLGGQAILTEEAKNFQ